MRAILLSCVIASGLSAGASAYAQEAPPSTPPSPAREEPLTGLWLTTDFPALTEQVGDDVRLDITIANKNLPPKRVALAVDGLPTGWSYEIDGGGKIVTAAMVQPDQDKQLTLKLTPPKDVKSGSYDFTVTGKTDAETLSLPVNLVLSEAKPASVTVEPKLPALRGTPRSAFDFDVNVTNDGPTDETFNLLAKAPDGFEVTFKEQYGSQELTSLPIKAGEKKALKISVKPPKTVEAGQYKVAVGAASPTISGQTGLVLDITGQPELSLAGPEGRLSGNATAGEERTFKFTVSNPGTAPARNVKFSASSPKDWKVTFDPESLDGVAPGADVPVSVSMTPAAKAIAGDYVVTVRTNGDGASDSASFRVTVLTSTMWGIAGLGIIGAAVVVLAFAVTRYGRR